ncbi:unnamed protein product [Danaus chrysippus]|uniref:(African queen) hypothetical protein n=1 Tax=Danaus chrysippus TaxID=151541 RepID=A0A8J2REA9_9NEOP|nr:unnamed protein product [Danaus chrysippus]
MVVYCCVVEEVLVVIHHVRRHVRHRVHDRGSRFASALHHPRPERGCGAAPLRSRSPWRPAQMTYRSRVEEGGSRLAGWRRSTRQTPAPPAPLPLDRWPMQNDECKVWIYLLGRK